MPTLEELYIASCITHYRHIYRMRELGMAGLGSDSGGELVGLHARTNKLVYKGIVLRGRVSPLQLLILNVNKIATVGPDGICYAEICPTLRSGMLSRLEYDEANNTDLDPPQGDRGRVRTLQRIFSLACFDKFNSENASRIAASDLDFYESNQNTIRKYCARLAKEKRGPSVVLEDGCGMQARFRKSE